MACSFGEIDGEEPIQPVAGPGTDEPATAAPDAVDTGSVTPTAPGRQQQSSSTTEEEEEYDGEDPFASPLGEEVRQILQVNCGNCHSGGVAQGGMDYILDMRDLVTNGKVVPGTKEDSQLFTRMQQQSMPPAFERVQRPTFGQIDQVGQFIDELDPGLFGADDSCQTVPFLSHDDQVQLMAADIRRLDSNDQPFTRYLTITYSTNAGDCEGERKAVERQRFALFKGINSVSTSPQIGIPQPINEDQTIYRIDIRDYDWDRGIDLEDDGIVDFDDAWLAIVDASGDYALQLAGDDADDLVADSQTAAPFLPVNAFIQFTELNDLYYALIGGRANLFDFELEVLGIDTVAEIADDNLLRAGFANSGVSKQERVLNRFDQEIAGGYAYWISFDFDGGNGNGDFNRANESIYEDPIDFAFAGGEAIFNLPNGLQAYYVAAADGTRLGAAPVGVVIDPAQNNGEVTNGASCHSCHNAGLITFTDTVRQFVVENRVLFDNDTFEAVMNQYPTQQVFQAAMDRDSELHVSRVERAGVPRTAPDPISRTFLDFQLGDIDSRLAAGELQVTEEVLLDNLDLLDPQLVNLGVEGGYVDRNIFTANYLDSFCTLHSVDENQPVNCP